MKVWIVTQSNIHYHGQNTVLGIGDTSVNKIKNPIASLEAYVLIGWQSAKSKVVGTKWSVPRKKNAERGQAFVGTRGLVSAVLNRGMRTVACPLREQGEARKAV